MKQLLTLFLILILGQACNNSKSTDNIDQKDLNQIMVEEVLQTSQYTYIRSIKDGQNQWFAIPAMQVKTGSEYYYKGGLEMKDFESKELNRVFDNIILLVEIYKANSQGQQPQSDGNITHSGTVKSGKADVSIETPKGGISIADLMKKKKSYKNKVVKVKGMVTKFNPAIMGKNWIHLQDGTEHEGRFDLTITTDEEVKTGEIVTFEGVIALDQDLGFGYFYEVLMEEAKIVK